MNRVSRRSKLKERRRKLEEDKVLRELCNDIRMKFMNHIQNDFKEREHENRNYKKS